MNKNKLLIQLSESKRTDFGRVAFSQQSFPQRVFSAIWALESEVNNDGFLSYFASWQFETANFAPAALHQIGAHACADLVEQALKTLSPNPLANSQTECERLVDSLDYQARARFEKPDEEFIAYPYKLTELLFAFVSDHPDVFGPANQSGVHGSK